jgi:hypothetical protein
MQGIRLLPLQLVFASVEHDARRRGWLPGKRTPDGVEHRHHELVAVPVAKRDFPVSTVTVNLDTVDAGQLADKRKRLLLLDEPNSQWLAHATSAEAVVLLLPSIPSLCYLSKRDAIEKIRQNVGDW